ncbi:MAG: DUF2079 domain-containing protein [bacterium]
MEIFEGKMGNKLKRKKEVIKKQPVFNLPDNIKIFISLIIVLLSSLSVGGFLWNLCYPNNLFSLQDTQIQSLLKFLIISCISLIAIWFIISLFLSKFSKSSLKGTLIKDGLSYLPCLGLIPTIFLPSFFPNLPNYTIYQAFLFVLIVGSILLVKLFLFPNFKISISSRFSLIVLSFLITSYIAIFTLITFTKLNKFLHGLCDLGMFTHVMWNTINGKILYFQIYGKGINFLGEHMSPILFVLVPFYWLYPDPRTLLFIQTVLISLGAIPVYLIAMNLLKERFAALCFVIAYLCYPFTGRVNLFEFHEVCFVIPFLLFCFYFLQRRNYKLYYLFMILSLSVKEEISIAIFMIGLFAFLGMKERKLGLITMIISIMWAFVSIKILIPFFRGGEEYSHIKRYVIQGESFLQIIQYYLAHPLLTIKNAFGHIQIATLCLLLVPLGLLPLFAPEVLCLSFPLIFLHFLSPFELQQTLQWQYSASIIPFLIIASIYGLRNIAVVKESLGKGMFFLSKFFIQRNLSIERKIKKIHSYILMEERKIIFCGVNFILSTSLIGNYFFSPSPLSRIISEEYEFNHHKRFLSLSLSPKDYSISIHRRLYFQIKELVPHKASLSVQDNLAPELCNRENIWQFPTWTPDIEYFLFDTSTHYTWTGEFGEDYKNIFSALSNSSDYQLLFYGDGFYLFCRKDVLKSDILSRYEEFLNKKPKSWEKFYVGGVVHSLIGNWKKGERMFAQASEINMNLCTKYLYQLGKFLYTKDRLDEAMKVFEIIVELDPKYNNIIEIYGILADFYYKKGMIDKAILKGLKIIELDPKNIEAHSSLGTLYYKKGLLRKAKLEFNKVLKFDPNNNYAKQILNLIKG